MQIWVKQCYLPWKIIVLDVEPDEPIEKVKAKIQEKEGIRLDTKIPPCYRVRWLRWKLEDGKTLSDYNIQPFSTLRLEPGW